MDYEHILTETQDDIGIIRFNRPESLNAWIEPMWGETRDQMTAWNNDDSIGAIVLTGEGRAFMAGADLNWFSKRLEEGKEQGGSAGTPESAEQQSEPADGGLSITEFIRQSKPTIAAVNGYAVGVGLTMILPCDVRIASNKALMSIRFIKMGLMPELGSTRILAQLVGLGNSTEMCLTGRMVPADEARTIGLVTQVTEPDELMETALAKAREIARNPRSAVMMIKELLRVNFMDPDLDAVMQREGVNDRLAQEHPDHAEAVAAFLEKRDPKFGGSRKPGSE